MAAAELSFCGPHGSGSARSRDEIPIGDLVVRQVGQPVGGVALGHFQEFVHAGQGVDLAETVHRPGQSASPATFRTPALLRALAEERARIEVKNALVRGGAVGPDQSIARGPRMGQGDAAEFFVACLPGGVEDHRHVHHDVDEQGIGGQKRAEILAPLHEPRGQGTARLDEHFVERRLAGQLVPRQIRIEEDEAQVVDVAVEFAVFQEARVVLGPLTPGRIAAIAKEPPHHAGEKAACPVGP